MATIFESPDNGKTIFGRPSRGTSVTSLTESPGCPIQEGGDYFTKRQQIYREDRLWLDIRNAAKTNSELQEILNQAIMLHTLCKEE
jgi:hypothetical protein